MGLVHTTQGLIDRDLLEVTEIVTEGDNHRAIKSVWTLGGEMVREDLAVSILQGHALAGDPGSFA